MLQKNRQAIALISVHADPAANIGKEEAGGQNVYVREVGEALASLGWQVDMFTRKVNSEDPQIVEHSDYCRTIRLKAGEETFIPRAELFPHAQEFVASFQKFQAKNTEYYPLIHTNYWLSAWVGLQLQKANNIQLVHTYHSLGVVKYASVDNIPASANTRLAVEKQILEQANCVIATSPQEEEYLKTLVSPLGNIEIIPCGTDTTNFQSISKPIARDKVQLSREDKIVLYVGRFDPRKGIETLIRACHLIKDRDDYNLKFVIVGGTTPNGSDEKEKQRLKTIISELGMTEMVIFAGRVERELLPYYYSAADVCVVPSHYEPFGLVAIEAMACGTSVVASDVGGLKFTVVNEETGLLVPAKDVEAFADAINRVLTHEVWGRKLHKQAKANVNSRFTWPSVAAQLSDLYRRLLAQSIMDKQFWINQTVANWDYKPLAKKRV